MLEKGLKFVLNRRDGIIVFNLSFILLLAKVDLIIEQQGCKENALVICSTGRIEMIFALLIKVITFYMQAFII